MSNTLNDGVPWIVYEATEMFDKIIKPDFYIFEYGSGGSTIYFLKKVKKLISIEHDIDWYTRVSNITKKLNINNHEYKLFEPQKIDENDGIDYSNYVADLNPSYYPNHHFKKYVSYIDKFDNESFDFVLIDGWSRPTCIEHSINKVKPGGFIVLDNSELKCYHESIKLLKTWERKDFFGWGPEPVRRKWQTTIFKKQLKEI